MHNPSTHPLHSCLTICPLASTSSSPRGPTRLYHWHGCARGVSWSRSAQLTCASHERKRPPFSLKQADCSFRLRISRLLKHAPRAGLLDSSWPRSRCKVVRTSRILCRLSPALTVSSLTT